MIEKLYSAGVLVFVVILFSCCECIVGETSDKPASKSCNPPYSFVNQSSCLKDASKLLTCQRRLPELLQDKTCTRQRALWNCVWHHLRSEECKGKFLLVRNQLPKQCEDPNVKNQIVAATAYGSRGLALWFACLHAFSACDQYWSCDTLDAFRACAANARKMTDPKAMPIVDKVTNTLEQIHQRVRCLNHSSQAVFPYEFKNCLSDVSLQALNHIGGMTKHETGVTMNASKEKGTCFSAGRLESNLNAFHKSCPLYLQKYDRESYAAIRSIFEVILPDAEGDSCRQRSMDPDYMPLQMCP